MPSSFVEYWLGSLRGRTDWVHFAQVYQVPTDLLKRCFALTLPITSYIAAPELDDQPYFTLTVLPAV
jgi:hypothetical protein